MTSARTNRPRHTLVMSRTAQHRPGITAPARTGEDLLGGEALPPGWADPRSRLARVRACLADFAAQREAAEARQRAQGQAWLDAQAAGERVTRPPAAVAVAAARIALEAEVARHQALAGEW